MERKSVNITLKPCDQAVLDTIAGRIEGQPWASEVYLVGGLVRDSILGRTGDKCGDLDILLADGRLEDLLECLAPVCQHKVTHHTNYGTAICRIQGHTVEFVRARSESYHPGSRKPCTKPGTLMDDILRRDFTINTLLVRLTDGKVVDPTGRGLADIEAKRIDTPIDPDDTFFDDPLRMLRAIRFAATLGFELRYRVTKAIHTNGMRLHVVSRERVKDELTKAFAANPSEALSLLGRCFTGLLEYTPLALLTHSYDCAQNKYHLYSVWGHTLDIVKNAHKAGCSEEVLWAALLHDVAKPFVKKGDHFLDHEEVGEQMAAEILRGLRFSEKFVCRVKKLVRLHMRKPTLKWSDGAYRRLMRDADDDLPDLLLLMDADTRASNPEYAEFDVEAVKDRIARLNEKTPRIESPLTGREIMELLGIPQGVEVGRIKDRLCEMVLNGELDSGDKGRAREVVLDMTG